MCGWQVKLCDPLVTHGPYLSALAVVPAIIRRYTNNHIALTLSYSLALFNNNDNNYTNNNSKTLISYAP